MYILAGFAILISSLYKILRARAAHNKGDSLWP